MHSMIAWWCATGSFWCGAGLLVVLVATDVRRAARQAREDRLAALRRVPPPRQRRTQPSPAQTELEEPAGTPTAAR